MKKKLYLMKVENPSLIRKSISAIFGIIPPVLLMLYQYWDVMIQSPEATISGFGIFVIIIACLTNRKKLPIPSTSGIPIVLILVGLVCKFLGDMIIYLGIVLLCSLIVSNIILKWSIKYGSREVKSNT